MSTQYDEARKGDGQIRQRRRWLTARAAPRGLPERNVEAGLTWRDGWALMSEEGVTGMEVAWHVAHRTER